MAERHRTKHRLLVLHRARSRAAETGTDVITASYAERIADRVTALVGSWRFIIVQSVLLVFWIAANALAWLGAWDPYPFILLNLVLSFQAAYTAPIIMMSQNRQAEIDRERAELDYAINLKAEREIERLHEKLDALRETEILPLSKLVQDLIRIADRRSERPPVASGATTRSL